MLPLILGLRRRPAVPGGEVVASVGLGQEDIAIVASAKLDSAFDDDAEHAVDVERGSADRVEDLANCIELLSGGNFHCSESMAVTYAASRMSTDVKVDMIRSMPLFARLDRQSLERVAQLADEVDVPAGRVLMRQGETGSEMFFIIDGRVQVQRDGRMLAEHGPGGWVGEMAILSE